jgi:hypothetical protein
MHWWATTGDTAALRTLLARERARARASGPSVEPAVVAYDTAAALAYLALARGDSSEALRRFSALPDTVCITCYPDRLTRARLETAAGRHREALRHLEERLLGWESPFDVLFALERGRVAERLGEAALARKSYQFVVDAWQFGDPEVQPYVAESRRALARLAGRRS